MNKKFLLSLLLCVLLVCSLIPLVYAANLLDGLNPDFEHGDLSHWTSGTGTNDAIAASELQAHHGSWSLKANIDAVATTYAMAYQVVADNTFLYLRAYVKFTDPTTTNGYAMYVLGLYHGATPLARLGIMPDADSTRFALNYLSSGTTYTTALWDSGSYIDTDTWFLLELYCLIGEASDGHITGWIDETQRFDVGSLDNDNYANHLDRVYVGLIPGTSTEAMEAYVDCVYADTTYIGPEEEGGPTAYVVDLTKTFTIGLTKAEQMTYNVILSQSITANLVFSALTSYHVILSQGTTIGLSQYAALVYYVTLSLSANLAMLQYFQTTFNVILIQAINPTLTTLVHTAFNVVLTSTWTTGLISYAVNATHAAANFIVDLALTIATTLLNPIEIATTVASAFALAGLALIIALSAFGALFLIRRKQN